MSDEIPNDAANAGEDKKKAEAITIRVKDQVRPSLFYHVLTSLPSL